MVIKQRPAFRRVRAWLSLSHNSRPGMASRECNGEGMERERKKKKGGGLANKFAPSTSLRAKKSLGSPLFPPPPPPSRPLRRRISDESFSEKWDFLNFPISKARDLVLDWTLRTHARTHMCRCVRVTPVTTERGLFFSFRISVRMMLRAATGTSTFLSGQEEEEVDRWAAVE